MLKIKHCSGCANERLVPTAITAGVQYDPRLRTVVSTQTEHN